MVEAVAVMMVAVSVIDTVEVEPVTQAAEVMPALVVASWFGFGRQERGCRPSMKSTYPPTYDSYGTESR